ncbi:FkbM family methyltransferase [Pseudomonas sp.]|uniref:FkbM family methyltransferase n=1 Tax=Pseudomonas sp. TaxID=306 RepID=UPI0019E357BD|nr:FkbM family methyltransferase [Pseudomonas sp.]MBF0676235.1 FkbM family methyltransferase [Pseudomonas sp.]
MSNEKFDLEEVRNALRVIGENDQAREKFLVMCKAIENDIKNYPGSVRDSVVGPLVDALHDENTVVRKVLRDGTVFEFLYRTKIARDFVLSSPVNPDHVWEPQTTKLLVHLASQCSDVLVGGAYFGDQAVLMARAMSARNGRCHTFEPNRQQLDMLRNNASLNGISNVLSWDLGLWSDSKTCLRLVGNDSFAHSVPTGGGGEEDFSTISIDDYCVQQNIAKLGLIMLDIEGAESKVLAGALKQLSRPAGDAPNIVFEVHRHYVDWTNGLAETPISRFLIDFGYTLFAVRDFNSNVNMSGRPVELIPLDDVYLEGPPHGFNVLAIKNERVLDGLAVAYCSGVSPKLLWHKDPALHHPLS